ncbi:hypothetical protein EYF80_066501 [Liparis tanakae]|uniref:Uncharacterized protein n=1 Tax=Liparis tanakae TaxID=230148 RepID=A0A4Z2E3S2_9TELE|nr:hypothetical protein EYF80_066501 [Liparis tanakae]
MKKKKKKEEKKNKNKKRRSCCDEEVLSCDNAASISGGVLVGVERRSLTGLRGADERRPLLIAHLGKR